MDFDPKEDPLFQVMLAKIKDGAKSLVQESTAEEQLEQGETIDKISFLRVEFFWFFCFQDVYGRPRQQQAYAEWKTVRDSPLGQEFLLKNPLYTAHIDLAMCKVANSIKSQWKIGQKSAPQPQQT